MTPDATDPPESAGTPDEVPDAGPDDAQGEVAGDLPDDAATPGEEAAPDAPPDVAAETAEPVVAAETAEPVDAAETAEPVVAAGTADPLDAVAILEASGRSRADLQAELRKSRKKEHKRQHRWRRRAIYALSAIVLIAGLGAGGIYFYAHYRYDQIKKIHGTSWPSPAARRGNPSTILVVGSDYARRSSATTRPLRASSETNPTPAVSAAT